MTIFMGNIETIREITQIKLVPKWRYRSLQWHRTGRTPPLDPQGRGRAEGGTRPDRCGPALIPLTITRICS
jgi:hypothetical protein